MEQRNRLTGCERLRCKRYIGELIKVQWEPKIAAITQMIEEVVRNQARVVIPKEDYPVLTKYDCLQKVDSFVIPEENYTGEFLIGVQMPRSLLLNLKYLVGVDQFADTDLGAFLTMYNEFHENLIKIEETIEKYIDAFVYREDLLADMPILINVLKPYDRERLKDIIQRCRTVDAYGSMQIPRGYCWDTTSADCQIECTPSTTSLDTGDFQNDK